MRIPSTHACAALFLISTALGAQSLPPPARTVFRCEEGGRVVYSDVPCMGARKIEVEPTRGVSRLSGQERIGQDVRNEHMREAFAEALKPVTGMNPRQLETFGRRLKLTPEDQRECQYLDRWMPPLELEEQRASGQARLDVQTRLFALRKRFRELGC